MAIRFFCPLGHRLTVPDDRAGKHGRCPRCQQRVIVPVPNPHPSGRKKRPAGSSSQKSVGDSLDSSDIEIALEKVLEEELGLSGNPPPPEKKPGR